MSNQSNIQMTLVAPANVPLPATNYYALFLSDGSSGTIANVLHRKDANGVVSVAQDTSSNFTNAKAQDAVGGILQTTDTVQLVYDATNRLIAANIKAASIATTHLIDAAVTNAKLANMPDTTFKMRAQGAGTGAPIDGSAAQAKAALSISYSDVSGLGSAATQPASAFDVTGAAAAAQAASQPLNTQLTAIGALATTSYGRSLLTVADVATMTTSLNLASQSARGLMAPTDKAKLDNRGVIGVLTANATSGTATVYTAMLSALTPTNLAAGTTIRVTLLGYAVAGTTVTFRIHAGGSGSANDAALWTSVTSPTLSVNQRGGFDGVVTLRSSGSSATIAGEAQGYANTTLMPGATATPTTGTVNATSGFYISLSTNVSLFGGFTTTHAVIELV